MHRHAARCISYVGLCTLCFACGTSACCCVLRPACCMPSGTSRWRSQTRCPQRPLHVLSERMARWLVSFWLGQRQSLFRSVRVNVVMIFRTPRQRCGAGGNLSLWACSRALGAAAPCLRPTYKPGCLATSPCGRDAAAGAFRKGVVGRWAAVRHVFSATGNVGGRRRAQAGRRSVAISLKQRSRPTLGGGGAWASANSSKSTLSHSDLERARDLGSGCGPNPILSDLEHARDLARSGSEPIFGADAERPGLDHVRAEPGPLAARCWRWWAC